MPDESFTPNTDDLVANNARFAERFDGGDLQVAPTRRLAVVSCMDSRMDTFQILGLANGEAHIVRNAGGIITDDVIRSLCLSQRLLGTREILVLHHTDCGLQKVDEALFKAELVADTGMKPWWAIESFDDPYEDVRQSMRRLMLTPFLAHKDNIRGFVYEVADGRVYEVESA